MTHVLLVSLGSIFTKDLLITLVIGLIAGLLAQFITPGRGYGILTSILIGIVGGWLGNRFFTFVSFSTDIPYLVQIVRATLGGIILVVILNLILGRDRRDTTRYKSH